MPDILIRNFPGEDLALLDEQARRSLAVALLDEQARRSLAVALRVPAQRTA